MPQPQAICQISEGTINLPVAYLDRTVNIFTSSTTHAPAFNISRDTLQESETLPAYIDRQLKLMQQHLKGWQQSLREAAALGEPARVGESVHASYLRDGKRIWQQQAVFTPDNRHVLVFTMTANAAFTAADNALFQELLGSFRPHA